MSAERVVRFDGQRCAGTIAYDDRGSGGVPVVLLHGFMCSTRMWADQLVAVSREHRVVSLDFPAHGNTSLSVDSANFSEDTLTDLTVEVMRARGIDRAVLVGFSMGGGVAVNAALRHPSAVAGLFLADVGGGSADPPKHRASMDELVDLLSRRGMDAFVDHMLTTPTFCDLAERDAASRATLRSIMMDCNPKALAALIAGVLRTRQPIQDRDLESVGVPTSVLVGELDHQCTVSSSDLARRIRGAEHVTLDGVGHMSPMEDPARFNDALLAFLKRVPE